MNEKRTGADEDADLVSSCKKGDTDAFETLVKRHQKRMFNAAYRIAGDYNEASEIVQDAFISAYKNIRKFREKAKFSTWLYTIVVNTSRNHLRQLNIRRSREGLSLDDPISAREGNDPVSDSPSAFDKLEQKEMRQMVRQCMDTLGSEFREVVVLRDISGFSYEEISDILKIPQGTVKSRIFRARDDLRRCLKKKMGKL
ncbi:MAG: sigma-70 family RNA polymerase sigma factor [Nitrospirota bacterium]